jgi:hypothetical protein
MRRILVFLVVFCTLLLPATDGPADATTSLSVSHFLLTKRVPSKASA